MLFFGQNALTFGRGTTCSLTFIAPVGFGAQQAGVFWLLEEEILHKERRDFVRRQNRGVRKICRGKKTKVSRPLFFNSSGSELWSEEDWLSGGVQRSGTETEWQSSDSAGPLGQVFWQLRWLKSCTGFSCAAWALASLRGSACSPWSLACAVGIDGCLCWLSEKDDKGKCRFIYTTNPRHWCRGL